MEANSPKPDQLHRHTYKTGFCDQIHLVKAAHSLASPWATQMTQDFREQASLCLVSLAQPGAIGLPLPNPY